MTTYQDIVDYMNKNYWAGFKLIYNDHGYTIKDNNDYFFISINKDSYSTIGSFNIDKGLSKLLADLLDTPVNQRNKPEIKHNVKPVTIVQNGVGCYTQYLNSTDKIITRINSFITKEFKFCPKGTLFIATHYSKDDLLQILSLFKDFDITVDAVSRSYPGYTLSIKAK